jgi:pseudouridine synthase
MLNKPRGLVTTTSDEKGRDTVFSCFEGHALPHLSPVGRLDKASEGLLLFTNDNAWANAITDPATHVPKTYHVQVSALADDSLLAKLRRSVEDEGERLKLQTVSLLRQGEKNSWLEITLDEGRNRHIRRAVIPQKRGGPSYIAPFDIDQAVKWDADGKKVSPNEPEKTNASELESLLIRTIDELLKETVEAK